MFKNTLEPEDCMAKRQQGYSKVFIIACNVGDLDLPIFGLQIASISKKCSHSAQ